MGRWRKLYWMFIAMKESQSGISGAHSGTKPGNKFTLFLISLQFLPCGTFELEEVSIKVLEIGHFPGECKPLSTIHSSLLWEWSLLSTMGTWVCLCMHCSTAQCWGCKECEAFWWDRVWATKSKAIVSGHASLKNFLPLVLHLFFRSIFYQFFWTKTELEIHWCYFSTWKVNMAVLKHEAREWHSQGVRLKTWILGVRYGEINPSEGMHCFIGVMENQAVCGILQNQAIEDKCAAGPCTDKRSRTDWGCEGWGQPWMQWPWDGGVREPAWRKQGNKQDHNLGLQES